MCVITILSQNSVRCNTVLTSHDHANNVRRMTAHTHTNKTQHSTQPTHIHTTTQHHATQHNTQLGFVVQLGFVLVFSRFSLSANATTTTITTATTTTLSCGGLVCHLPMFKVLKRCAMECTLFPSAYYRERDTTF